jgi:hypothetical protein
MKDFVPHWMRVRWGFFLEGVLNFLRNPFESKLFAESLYTELLHQTELSSQLTALSRR